jgi:tyrosinase
VTVTARGQLDTKKLGYEYDKLPPRPVVVAAKVSMMQLPVSIAAMKGGKFTVGSEGGHIMLAPAPEAEKNQKIAPQRPSTLVLKDVKLLDRPPAPLHVFLNLPEGTAPALNSPFHVGLNFFNWNTGTGGPITQMVTPEGEVKHVMPGTGEFRFSVGEVLARQKAENLWDGGTITVTIATLGADVSKGILMSR